MSEGRKIGTWMNVVYCLFLSFDAVTSVLRLRSLLQHGYHFPAWYVAAFVVHLVSCPLLLVATWFLGQERLQPNARGLIWSSAFLLWAASKIVWFWRITMIDLLIFALALGQLWFHLPPGSDPDAEFEVLDERNELPQ